MTYMSAGDWALLWANHERNGMTWANIVQGIREETVLNMHEVDEMVYGDERDETADATPLRSTLDTFTIPLIHCTCDTGSVANCECKPNPVQDSFR